MDHQAEIKPAFTEGTEQEMAPRRRLSPWAVLALISGLASAAALVNPLLWPVAGVGLLISVLAVMYFARHKAEVAGEQLAIVGLVLSLLFVVAAPTHAMLRQVYVSTQAVDIGSEWLDYVLHGKAFYAYESLQPVVLRRPLDAQLTKLYETTGDKNFGYQAFLADPLIRTLIRLGDQASANHYQVESIQTASDGAEIVSDVYAITFSMDEKKTSFFVRLVLERREDASSPRGLWRVKSYEGGIKPLTPPRS